MNIEVNVFIIILSVMKKLKITIGLFNENRIIIVNQIKKNIIRIVKKTSLFI